MRAVRGLAAVCLLSISVASTSDRPAPARADLARADLARADLARADLARADLAQADLAQADLARADPGRAGRAAATVVAADGPGTRPVHDYAAAIREQVWVQTPADSDADGRPDRVAVRIIRPAATAGDLRVPVILQASPYFAGLNDVPNHDDVDRTAGDAARRGAAGTGTARSDAAITFAGYLDNYFVPRGYAVAYADSLGSGGSDGCPTSGGRTETLAMKAVVEWFAGRAPAFDASGAPVRAGWSSGRTGMIGVSYNGTLANAVAATGVRGLASVVPIAAISSWYDYYRANGGVVAPGGYQGEDTDVLAKAVLTRAEPQVCAPVMAALERDQDRVTGDASRFWAERDYVPDAGRVRASVLLVHGLHDDNVRTSQAGRWWQALAAHRVPRKIWLHQAAHTDPFHVRRDIWLATLHRWFDQWLQGIDTGIMAEPMADVEVAPGDWRTAATWPAPGTHSTSITLGERRETFVDDPSRTAEDLTARPDEPSPNRFAYLSPPLPADRRLAGTPGVTVRADLAGPSPYLTALLVDYGPAVRWVGMRTLSEQDCIGPGIAGDPGCFARREPVTAETPYEIVSRGWLDVRNRTSPSVTTRIRPGHPYTFRWNLQTQDHLFPAGHRIGLILISTERDHTLRYPAGTEVGINAAASRLTLPLTRPLPPA